MPTYSYACKACHHAFDIRQSFTDDSLTTCPECGEPTLRKVLHPVGIAFKGSGFYRNDSKASPASAGSAKKESDGSATTKETTSESAAKPESKPDSKTESKSSASSSSVPAASSTSS